MNETGTRAGHLESVLEAAGWGVIESSRIWRGHSIAPGRIEGRGKWRVVPRAIASRLVGSGYGPEIRKFRMVCETRRAPASFSFLEAAHA